jgi:uncharacterized protein
MFQTMIGQYLWPRTLSSEFGYPPRRIILSTPGDRCYPAGRIGGKTTHDNYSAIVRRLKRADGHLQTIIEMIEQGRPCVQIAQQLQAVESAIDNAKKALIHDHIAQSIERPLKAAGAPGRAPLKDFKLIAKYL